MSSVAEPQYRVESEATPLATVVAAAAMVAVGMNLPLVGRLSSATLTVVALAPVWLPVVRRFRWVTGILALSIAAVAAGLLLQALAPWDRAFDAGEGRGQVLFLLTWTGAIGLMVWARSILGTAAMAGAWAIGGLAGALPAIATSDNLWKYQLSIPTTILLLSLLTRAPWVSSVAALIGLGALGVLLDSRSFFGLCVMAAVIVAWQHRTRAASAARIRVRGVLFVAALAVGLYLILSTLILQGVLGPEIQARSAEQVEAGGSLILGGRPEWTATVALMATYPMGFGIGAVPALREVLVAKSGLATVGLNASNGYVDHYLFGEAYELHSIVGTFWAWFGLVGAALALLLGSAILVGMMARTSALGVFAGVSALWFLFFGPPYSNLPLVCFAVAVLVPQVRRERRAQTRAPDPLTAPPQHATDGRSPVG